MGNVMIAKASRTCRLAALAAAACIALAAVVFTAPAWAEELEVVDQNGEVLVVSDDVTHIQVDKLVAGTHEWVKGAKMQIVDAETGDEVASWTTGEETFELDASLVAGNEYILREVKAPKGYVAVDDVRFTVNEEEGSGITLDPSLADAEWVEMTGIYKVTLYDSLAEEQVEYKDRPGSSSKGGSGSTAKTGDVIGFGIVAGFVVIVIASGVAVAISRRRMG